MKDNEYTLQIFRELSYEYTLYRAYRPPILLIYASKFEESVLDVGENVGFNVGEDVGWVGKWVGFTVGWGEGLCVGLDVGFSPHTSYLSLFNNNNIND